MPKLRNDSNKKFTIIGNYILQSCFVSLKAIGMYAKLVSLPDNWKFTETGLVSICKENKNAVKSALNELEELGLLFRFQEMGEDGRFGETIYYISSTPMTQEDKQNLLNKEQTVKMLGKSQLEPTAEKTMSVETMSVNRPLLNTNILNTKELNNTLVDLPSTKDNNFDYSWDNFELIWKEYPRKDGKANAYKSYLSWGKGKKFANKTIKLSNKQMWKATVKYAEYIVQNEIKPQFIKMGSTFFNSGIIDFVDFEE